MPRNHARTILSALSASWTPSDAAYLRYLARRWVSSRTAPEFDVATELEVAADDAASYLLSVTR